MIRFIFILAGAVGGYDGAQEFGWPGLNDNRTIAIILYMILGSAIGYVAGGILGRRLSLALAWIEETIAKTPTVDLLLGVAGLFTGLVLAFLVTLPLALIGILAVRLTVTVVTYAIFIWLGIRVAIRRRNDLGAVLAGDGRAGTSNSELSGSSEVLLDTNIIIDGRVVDIAAAGFLERKLILPRFVLQELHLISDSGDTLKRQRGRRGLDILNDLQLSQGSKVEIIETDYPEIHGVDAKLVKLAQERGAVIMTNDYNLNKVAQLEGVSVINLNELSNALKPVVLPGETMSVRIVHKGKESGQGVGYLDDGTMVVIENGSDLIGEDVDLEVTSMLQTSAGKMIFSRMKAAGSA